MELNVHKLLTGRWVVLFGMITTSCSSRDPEPAEPPPLGLKQCRPEGTTCPSECVPVNAAHVDLVNRCVDLDDFVTCSKEKPPEKLADWCFVNESTGAVYRSLQWALEDPNFYNYRLCTREEHNKHDPIIFFGQPCTKK